MTQTTEAIYFYKYVVNSQVFYKSKYTYALVNLKPLVPGHVLVVPLRRDVLRFGDLTPEESQDYMSSLQLIHRFIAKLYKADALNIAIQDGPESGQSIPHLHTHLIPRYKADRYGDDIYRMLENKDLDLDQREFFLRKAEFQRSGGFKPTADEDRDPRSAEAMANDAQWLRDELEKYLSELNPLL